MNAFLINILLYLFTFGFFVIKDKKYSLRVVCWGLFTIFASASFFTIDTGIYYKQFGHYAGKTPSIIPFIFNYILIYVLTYGLKGYEKIDININSKVFSRPFVKYAENFIIITSILYFMTVVVAASILSSLNLGDIYDSIHNGENVLVFPAQWMNIVYYRTQQILNIAYPFIYLIEFIKISTSQNIRRSTFVLFLVFIPQVISCAVMANRAGVIFNIFSFVFFILIFWKYLNLTVRRSIKSFGILFLVLIIMALSAISLSRAGNNSKDSTFDALRYFGESFPNLAYQIWDVNGNYLMGMRTFPSIYSMFHSMPIDLQDASFYEKHIFYNDLSGYPIMCFKTFYGDLYCEWGPIMPFVFVTGFVLVSFLLRNLLKNTVFSLVVVYFIYYTIVWGLFGANQFSENGFEQLFWDVVIAYILNKIIFIKKDARRNSCCLNVNL